MVGELCAQLDGMPLAIELATARSAALGIAGLRAGLTDRLRLLSGGRGGDERHRSLRAVLDWSHDLLDEEERTALRRLGRFVGDFDIGAASAVTGLPASRRWPTSWAGWPTRACSCTGPAASGGRCSRRCGPTRWTS